MSPTEKLAPGAPPAADFIPLIVPEIRGNEWEYVKECLDTNWVSSVGTYVDRFEKLTAEFVGAKYAVATVNGTASLHIALMLAGVEANDEVLVSTLTFIAPANAIRYVGAWPVFIDAEPNYWQMDPAKVIGCLENDCRWDGHVLVNKKTGRRVKAILPVHILGHPVDLDPILEVAAKFSLPVIEDATEGLGARYRGRSLGSFGQFQNGLCRERFFMPQSEPFVVSPLVALIWEIGFSSIPNEKQITEHCDGTSLLSLSQ